MSSVNDVRKGFELLNKLASRSKDIPALIALVQQGASLEERDNEGRTPLMLAASDMQYIDVARELIKAGADCKALDAHGGTVLFHCVKSDNAEIMQAAIDQGADVNSVNKYGRPLLMDVVTVRRAMPWPVRGVTGAPGCVEVMIRNNADLNIRDPEDNTPLISAVRFCGNFWYAARLVVAGADESLQNIHGETAYTIYGMDSAVVQQQLQKSITRVRASLSAANAAPAPSTPKPPAPQP